MWSFLGGHGPKYKCYYIRKSKNGYLRRKLSLTSIISFSAFTVCGMKEALTVLIHVPQEHKVQKGKNMQTFEHALWQNVINNFSWEETTTKKIILQAQGTYEAEINSG